MSPMQATSPTRETGLAQRHAHQPHAGGFLPGRQPYRVRIGPLSVFVLVAILALSVMGVLVFTTANASFVLSRRQASFVSSAYDNERAAQTFVAALDDALAPVREGVADGGSAARQAEGALDAACAAARGAGKGRVSAMAHMDADGVVAAAFSCGDGRSLAVTLRIGEDGTYAVEGWQTTKVQNEEQEDGRLYVVGS